jgi:hypothetical protein
LAKSGIALCSSFPFSRLAAKKARLNCYCRQTFRNSALLIPAETGVTVAITRAARWPPGGDGRPPASASKQCRFGRLARGQGRPEESEELLSRHHGGEQAHHVVESGVCSASVFVELPSATKMTLEFICIASRAVDSQHTLVAVPVMIGVSIPRPQNVAEHPLNRAGRAVEFVPAPKACHHGTPAGASVQRRRIRDAGPHAARLELS